MADELADTIHIVRNGAVTRVVPAPIQPGGMAFEGTSVTSRVTYATVQQPNTVAIDDASGEVVLTGSTPQGALQFIPLGPPPTGPR